VALKRVAAWRTEQRKLTVPVPLASRWTSLLRRRSSSNSDEMLSGTPPGVQGVANEELRQPPALESALQSFESHPPVLPPALQEPSQMLPCSATAQTGSCAAENAAKAANKWAFSWGQPKALAVSSLPIPEEPPVDREDSDATAKGTFNRPKVFFDVLKQKAAQHMEKMMLRLQEMYTQSRDSHTDQGVFVKEMCRVVGSDVLQEVLDEVDEVRVHNAAPIQEGEPSPSLAGRLPAHNASARRLSAADLTPPRRVSAELTPRRVSAELTPRRVSAAHEKRPASRNIDEQPLKKHRSRQRASTV